jgi:hypothetical protein
MLLGSHWRSVCDVGLVVKFPSLLFGVGVLSRIRSREKHGVTVANMPSSLPGACSSHTLLHNIAVVSKHFNLFGFQKQRKKSFVDLLQTFVVI